MAQSIAVATSTSAAVTATLILDPKMRSTSVLLSATATTASSNSTVQLETALTDPSAIPLGGPAASWALLSSATGMASSAIVAAGLIYTILAPVGAVRVNSTSGSTGGVYTFTLQALQSVTA